MNTHRLCVCQIVLCCIITLLVAISDAAASPVVAQTPDGKTVELYEGSYALVIGNNDYIDEGWGKLKHAVQDAEEVADALKANGFEVTLEKNLTADSFKEIFVRFCNKYGQAAKNRMIVYYAGHGYSRTDPYDSQRQIGYLVMVDTPNPNDDPDEFELKSIPLDDIDKKANQTLAHHMLFLFDSCFSGSIFDTMRGGNVTPQYITDSVSRPVRQFISAGQAGETVPDVSIFKKVFISLLRGEYPEATGDGYLTGSELGQFLYREVVNTSNNQQHPQYGKSRNLNLNKGDFVFVINSGAPIAQNRSLVIGGSTTEAAPPSPSACVNVKTAYPPAFPYALINSMESGDFPYWFHVTMTNTCQQDVLFTITFNLLSGPASISADKEIAYKIPAGETFAQSIPFPIDFLTKDIDDTLVVKWLIRQNDDKTILDQGTAKIIVFPKTRYCWNLINFDGTPVSQEFLFAALTAWAQATDANMKELAQTLVRGVTEKQDFAIRARQWFEQCYAQFQSAAENPIEIAPFQKQFPPNLCWDISSPITVLDEKWGDPLEAALFVGALTQKASIAKRFGVQMALFVLPGENDAPQRILVAWTTDAKTWQAIDMAQANALAFADNVEKTTPQLTALFDKSPEIAPMLKENGMFIDKDRALFAIDIDKAAKRFRIRGLP